MARTEQTLTIRIGANISEALSGLDQVGRRLDVLGKVVARTGATLSRNLTAPIVAVGGAALVAAIRIGNVADELLDLEQMTGLSTDALQEFRRVATGAGVAQDTIAKAAQNLTTRFASGAEGSADLQLGLSTLGIAARNAAGDVRPMDEIVGEAVAKLADMEDTTARNILATRVFGRAAKDLAPVLGLGSKEIERLRQEAGDLGLVMGRDSLDAANQFRIQVDTLKSVTLALANELGIVVIPMISGFVALVTDSVLPALRRMVEIVGRVDEKWLVLTATVLAGVAAIGPLVLVAGKLIGVLGLILSPAGLVVAAIAAIVAITVVLIQNWDRFVLFWVQTWLVIQTTTLDAVQGVLDALARMTAVIPGIGTATEGAAAKFRAFADGALASTASRMVELEAKIAEGRAGIDALADTADAATAATARLGDTVQRALPKFDATTVAVDRSKLAVQGLTQTLDLVPTTMGRVTTRTTEGFEEIRVRGQAVFRDLEVFTSRASQGMETAFTDAMLGNIGAIKSFVDETLKQLARLLASRLFKRVFGTAIGAVFGGPGGAVSGGLFSGFFAGGGVIGSGRFGVVGERGPELVTAGAAPVRITPLPDAGGPSADSSTSTASVAAAILQRIGPPPSSGPPQQLATDAWWRRAFGELAEDARRRGAL